jgi:hypothetical protein
MLRRIRRWLLVKLAGSELVVIGARVDGSLLDGMPRETVVVANGKWQGPALLRPRNKDAELIWG